jgi:hypothetical protein
MALQSIGGIMHWPNMARIISAAPSTVALTTIDAAGEYDGVVIQAREAMTISHVAFRPGTASGSPTWDIRIEGVDATTGLPDGNLVAANTNIISQVIVTGTWQIEQLTSAASISAGQIFAVKLLHNAGSCQTSSYGVGQFTTLPYQVVNTGTPATARISSAMVIALGSSTTSFYNVAGLLPAQSVTNNTFSNSVAGAKRGLRFRAPFKCSVVGARWFANGAVGDFNLIVEDSSGNELSSSSTAFDGNKFSSATTSSPEAFLDNAVTLTQGTDYRIMFEPTSATNINISTLTVGNSANYRSATPYGSNSSYTTYTTGGGYSDTTTQLPLIDILIDQFDDGASTTGGQSVYGG